MVSGTIRACALGLAGVVATAATACAQPYAWPAGKTLTIVLDGTLGPILSGSDPAGLDGQSATVTVAASESLKPYKMTSSSASYHLPTGAIVVDVNGTNYASTSRSTMSIKLGSKADVLSFKSSLSIDGQKIKVSDVTSLQSGSWTNVVLQHPAVFSPSPQNLSSPTSNFTYTVFGETTVLGVAGTASDSDAADAEFADEAAR
jgi:hypothetical protein